MGKTKISVIVPVFNAEKYLRKCIESVKQQTHENWELVLVDDGSTDESRIIVDAAAKDDERIVAVHQKNAGPGIARNRGIEKVTGDFVVFLDSDDYIDQEYFRLLDEMAEGNDVIFIDVMQVDINGKVLKEEKMSEHKLWSKDRLLRSQMTGKIPWGGVRKAVRLTLLKDNKIEYTSHCVGEEALYSFRVLYSAKRVAFLDEKPVYYYVNHENSQSKTVMEDPWGGVVHTIQGYLKESQVYDEYADTLNAFSATATVVSLDRIAKLYKGPERRDHAKKRVDQFLEEYDRKEQIDKSSMSLKAKVFVPFLLRGLYHPVILCSKLRSLTG